MTPPSATPDSPIPPTSTHGSGSGEDDDTSPENNLNPFFVLHKPLRKKTPHSAQSKTKRRRRIDLTPESPPQQEKVVLDSDPYQHLCVEAFNLVWAKIDTTIKQVLRDINTNVFDEILEWACESFASIRSTTATAVEEVTRSYPLITTDIACRRIFTGLVFTQNVEFVDDLLTFKQLNVHLKSQGCHVVNLSSLEFTAKNGVGGCVTSLLRQLVMVDPDVADISILASWYSEQENYDNPLVVIIDDMERCNAAVLAEFILTLSEWVIKLPVILVMGVATTVDAPRNLLPASALRHLHPCKFALGSPVDRLNAIVDAVILSTNSGFVIGYKVAVFLRNYFLKQDGTVTAFIRALKIACAKHFGMEPLSFLCKALLEEDSQGFLVENCVPLPESMLEHASNLPSCKSRDKTTPVTGEVLVTELSEIMKLRKNWCSIFLCLCEAAKFQNVQLLDILCEALDPTLYSSRDSSNRPLGKDLAKTSSTNHSSANKGRLIFQVIRKIRDLPGKPLHHLLQTWKQHSEEIAEVHGEVQELQSMLKLENESNGLPPDLMDLSKKPASRSYMNTQRDISKVSEKAALLMERMVRDYLKPIECTPFHEIFCFNHVDMLQLALIGDPRRMIQVDLLKSQNCLRCSCCAKSGNVLLPSMHDTSIMYTLAQEQGNLINLHDWFQSFKSTIFYPSTNAKRKMHSPSPRKRKQANELEDTSDALVQARFCRAVIELQMTGLLRMPSKRRPEYVQRAAFGL